MTSTQTILLDGDEAACGDEGEDLLVGDGLALASLAKSMCPSRPVVVVSSQLPAAAVCNADQFIAKPCQPATFVDVIVSLIGPPR